MQLGNVVDGTKNFIKNGSGDTVKKFEGLKNYLKDIPRDKVDFKSLNYNLDGNIKLPKAKAKGLLQKVKENAIKGYEYVSTKAVQGFNAVKKYAVKNPEKLGAIAAGALGIVAVTAIIKKLVNHTKNVETENSMLKEELNNSDLKNLQKTMALEFAKKKEHAMAERIMVDQENIDALHDAVSARHHH